MSATPNEHVAIAIVGAGPAGLTAAAELAARVDGRVLVFEREAEAGGIPRHSAHTGYGIRDLRRLMSGPEYARRLTAGASTSGAEIETGAMVTGWSGERQLEITSPQGRRVVEADAVILATGARERPRAARGIAGDRPEGVLTTGHLQNAVHLHHARVGTRAVVVGAELVSWSAVLTLREAGCATVAMTTTYARPESYGLFRLAGKAALRVPVVPRNRVTRINGTSRVESVEVTDLDTGARRTIACDTVILTGDWIPDHELARTGGLRLDGSTLGPSVDTSLQTSRRGVFAIGNLLHPVDTADVAALDGRHVASHVVHWLANAHEPEAGPNLVVEPPLRWVAPQVLRRDGTAPPRGRLLLWTDELCSHPVVVARQDGRLLARKRVAWPAAPGRVFRLPFSIVAGANPAGGPVILSLAS